MIESSNKRSVMVGVFVFLGVSLLIMGVLMIGNLRGTFKKNLNVVSLFNDVNGLQTGNNVWFSGVKIGTVSDIRFFGKSQVQVRMNIETRAQEYIRKDAKVKISTDGLIGNKILVIYDGTPLAQEVQEGDTLAVEKTFSSEDMINMLQENNKNVLAITTDFKNISKKLAEGDGSIAKLLNESTLYDNLNGTASSLRKASYNAELMLKELSTVTKNLNKKGTLTHDLMTDTVMFGSLKHSILQFQQVMDTASGFITDLKSVSSNPNTPVGVMLHDEEAGTDLKHIMNNLESSSHRVDETLHAIQHSFLLRGLFRRKARHDRKNEK